ncbi:mariner Mos1 transposase [Nephila pilipes]|uniref:Mariner Mos1 transposase n=1 Tax=Nephila pilipes TaxID=299642 RepID=A0A8X6U8D5_NEPPI|nr:mariner Mos1 transposase [Nephila pilipes]
MMLTFFFDCNGPLFLDFLPQKCTIDSPQYCSILTELRKANSQAFSRSKTAFFMITPDHMFIVKPREPYTNSVGNCLNTQHKTQDLSPCEFHIFGPPKKIFEVKVAVQDFFKKHKSFYTKGIDLPPNENSVASQC